MLHSTSQRHALVIEELWKYLLINKIDNGLTPARLGIIEGVLNRQTTEAKFAATCALNVAEHFGCLGESALRN